MKSSLLLPLTMCLLLVGVAAPPGHSRQGNSRAEQEQVDRLCPVITVECPDTIMPGSLVKFTAKISGAGPSPSLNLSWTVSAGTIFSPQTQHVSTPDSTTEMTVDTTGLTALTDITATVSVGGLPRSCNVQASCTSRIIGIVDHFPLDEYGNIRFSDERARLDNFAIELQNDPTAQGYIICYGGRRGRRGEAAARCERAKKYLVSRRAVDARRLFTVDGGFRENRAVVLWIMPPGMKAATSPTVDPREVQFIEGPRKARGRTARRRRAGV
jgi:hypothetical protein